MPISPHAGAVKWVGCIKRAQYFKSERSNLCSVACEILMRSPQTRHESAVPDFSAVCFCLYPVVARLWLYRARICIYYSENDNTIVICIDTVTGTFF